MKKKFFIMFVLLAVSALVVAQVFAAAPSISNIKFKTAGDSPKVAVFFDQSVMGASSTVATTTSFTLGGASSSVYTIQNVEANDRNNLFILTFNNPVNISTSSQLTIAASSSLANQSSEAATTTPVNFYGKGDNTAPEVLGVYQHNTSSLDIMFSEEVDTQTAQATSSYSNLQTSAAGDTPGISSRWLVPEKNFVILMNTASTTLGWGTGNTINVGSLQDLVGNPLAATSTYTILPAVKISEVKAQSSVNVQDEFIELYNFGDVNIDVSANTFFLHIINGATSSDASIPLTFSKTQIPEKGYFLIGSQTGYSGTVALDAYYATSTDFITANSVVYISATSTGAYIGNSTASQLKIDLIGMGTSIVSETATTSALAAGKSFERKAKLTSTTSTMATAGSDEFMGNSSDSNNNNSDFILRDSSQPQNSASPKEFPWGGPGASDVTGPQVTGSFPSGNAGEMVANNLSYVGFGFNEPVQENTVTTSSVKLFANSNPSVNLCSSVSYANFPSPGVPQGKCNISSNLAAEIHTFKIFSTSSPVVVRDLANNALNQDYVITFTPSSGGTGFTFMAPPVFTMGTLPFPGAVNIPTNIQKIFIKFSGNVATSTLNTTNLRLLKLSDSSAVPLSSVSSTASGAEFSSDVAIINLNATLLTNTKYQISISGIKDLQNNNLAPSFIPSFEFTTGSGADVTGPVVTGKLPNISIGVPVNAIDIHIMTDDRLDASTIASNAVKIKQNGNEIPGVVDFDPFTGEIIFLSNNVFLANTQYTVSVNATGTTPCIKNISGLCLQDNDGTANNLYEFSFTTGAADTQGPKVMFANADQRNLSVSFDEPINKLEAENLSNYSLVVGGATSTLSNMAGQNIFYDTIGRTVVISNINLMMNATFTIAVSNVHDLSGNLINPANASAQGTVLDMSKTGGFVGPGGGGEMMMTGFMPENFSTSTFGFVPQIEVRPMSPLAGASTNYFVGIPISQQIKSNAGGGKIILTFPTGFDISSAAMETNSPMVNDINGPGAGTIGVNPLALDSTARTITITLTSNTRCDNGNIAPCSGDAHDFLNFDLRGIVNSSISKDISSSGYTVDVKMMNDTTVLESLTSRPFYLMAGGTNSLVISLSASGATSGTSTIRMFSPLTGPREAVSTAFSGGAATSTFIGLVDGDYFVYTDPIITLGGTDYIGRAMPSNIRVSGGATTTMALSLQSTAGLTTVIVNITAPANKNIDVFANSADKFIMKATTTTGATQNISLKLSDGTWFIGVGPSIPKGLFSGPPPAPDFVMQPPIQVIISGSSIKESSGIADDGTIAFTLASANLSLNGTVVDASNRALVGAEVFAYSPLGGFGTHGSTDASGKFSLKVAAGTYQMGAFTPGLPPASETAVEMKSDGNLVVNGQTTSTVVLKLIKPERTISGKVLNQNNNPVQGAGVYAYCDPSVSNNACFGPGAHTGSPTNSDGSYILYIKSGTWKVGAFLPGFGELPEVQQIVSSSDISNLNFSPSTNITFNDVSGTVCRDTDVSGNLTTCGSGDQKISGAFIRASSASGANNTVTDQSGIYKIKIPANNNYTIEAFDPALGKLKSLTNVDVSTSASGKDIVVGNPRTVVVNVKDSSGAAITINQLFVDLFDFTNQTGNYLEIKNAASSSISLPDGDYRVRASLPGKTLPDSAIVSDNAGTTVATSTLTINGNEVIKIVIPALGTISGKVYKTATTSGNELAEAFVNFTDPQNGIFIGSQANASGTYTIKLPLGDYNAIAQKAGYIGNPVKVSVSTSTVTTTQDFVVNEASLTISGTITISNLAASRAFVKAEKLGGGFSSAQTDSSGAYSLAVTSGTWRVFAVAEGYAEQEYSSLLEISASRTGINIDLTTKVTLSAPKVCQITPAQGGTCSDDVNGIKVIVPPAAFGSDTNPATLTIKQTNIRQITEGAKPVGNGFDFEVLDSSGNKISTFNSALTLEFTQSTSTLIASGISTKTKADGIKISLWSETIKDYDILTTTVEFLDASNALVSLPNENLSNVSYIRFKALTTHFSGGGPSEGGDSLSPAAPTGVSGSALSNSISVSWSAVTTNSDGSAISDLSDYRIWRSASSGSGFSVIGTTASSTTSFNDTSASSLTTYYYRVTARDTNSNESAQSSSSAGASYSVSSGGGGGSSSYVAPTATATTTIATTTVTIATTTVLTATTTLITIAQPTLPTTASAVAKLQLQLNELIAVLKNLLKQAKSQGIALPAGTEKYLITATIFDITIDLEIGSKGDNVVALQDFLESKRFFTMPQGVAKGYFGNLTKSALAKYQASVGIQPAVGYFGPKTRNHLKTIK